MPFTMAPNITPIFWRSWFVPAERVTRRAGVVARGHDGDVLVDVVDRDDDGIVVLRKNSFVSIRRMSSAPGWRESASRYESIACSESM